MLDAARTLAYRPSRFGRGLVKPQHRTLGLLVTDLTNPYYPELASAVIGEASAMGWTVLVAEERHTSNRAAQLVDLANQVDALVGAVYAESDPLAGVDERLQAIPVVRIDPPTAEPGHGVVGLNLRLAIEESIELLAGHGVRRPAMIDAHDGDRPTNRAELFCDGFAARGVEVRVVPAQTEQADSAEGGRAGMAAALAADPHIDAALCFNDLMALGALGELRSRGIRVPDQIRVIGVDGLSLGTLVDPTLTTLAIDLTEVARHAVELAVGIESGEFIRTACRTVSYRLLVRESA